MENFPMTLIVSCVATSCLNHGGEDIGCIMKVVEIDDKGKCLSFRLAPSGNDGPTCTFEPAIRGDNHLPVYGSCVHENQCQANGLRYSKQCKIGGGGP
jgi:hypothetical protein